MRCNPSGSILALAKGDMPEGKAIRCNFQNNSFINHCALKISIQILMSQCLHERQISGKSSNYLVIKNCAQPRALAQVCAHAHMHAHTHKHKSFHINIQNWKDMHFLKVVSSTLKGSASERKNF